VDSPTLADAILTAARYRAALAKAVALLEQAEFDGRCSPDDACHRCAWDSDRDILVEKWRHLIR